MNALVLEVVSDNEHKEVTIMGKRGVQQFSCHNHFERLAVSPKLRSTRRNCFLVSILNDFIAENTRVLENSLRL